MRKAFEIVKGERKKERKKGGMGDWGGRAEDTIIRFLHASRFQSYTQKEKDYYTCTPTTKPISFSIYFCIK